MSPDLENKIKFYPFVNILYVECEDGWFNLICNLLDKLTNVHDIYHIKIVQIKEKFGQLRINIKPAYELHSPLLKMHEAYSIIEYYENLSLNVCEICGKSPAYRKTCRRIITICENCFAIKNIIE